MSLNYNFIDTLKLLLVCFKHQIFISIIVSMIIMLILLIYNTSNIKKYIILSINVLVLITILIHYLSSILTFKFNNPINNIYFYALNVIIYILLFSYIVIKNKQKNIDYVFYSISLIGILYLLYMTNYLKGSMILIIGNVFPIIKFGNIIFIIYYLIKIITIIKNKWLVS